MQKIRVSIDFYGRLSGDKGPCYPIKEVRRTIEIPSPFTYETAKEAAKASLCSKQDDTTSYDCIVVDKVAFN